MTEKEKSLKVCFRLSNGLLAKAYLFNDEGLPKRVVDEVREHCCRLCERLRPFNVDTLRKFSMKVQNPNEIHLQLL